MNKTNKKNSFKPTARKRKSAHERAFAKKLQHLSVEVTAIDRQRFIKKHTSSKATVSRYLNGYTGNIVLAAKMYKFFNACILKRKAQLQ
jgi:hypothetical protein